VKECEYNIDALTIIKKESRTKGEKSYYVKEMILEYGNEMKKNLLEIGSLSHDEIKDLIVNELRELSNYIKKLENNFE
jgi:predicted DNA-binding protein